MVKLAVKHLNLLSRATAFTNRGVLKPENLKKIDSKVYEVFKKFSEETSEQIGRLLKARCSFFVLLGITVPKQENCTVRPKPLPHNHSANMYDQTEAKNSD
jgi:hypothetical protein